MPDLPWPLAGGVEWDYLAGVPLLSTFFGIVVRMYFEDHDPEHFHVSYAEHHAIVEIETGVVRAGRLPRRCAVMVEEWRLLHLAELRSAWKAVRASRTPRRIPPLR